MSLFGSFLHDEVQDPFFGGPNHLMNQMNSMMNTMLQNPFLNMMPIQHQQQPQYQHQAQYPQMHQHQQMIPFGAMGMNMGAMAHPFGMQSMFQMGQTGSPMYSSSSVTTMTTGPDGRPQVYQASTTTRTGAGGIREVQQSVSDSRSGVRKMAIGRHLGERGHVVEKEQNYHTGEAEQREDFINIEEEEATYFDDEWNQRARSEAMYGPRLQLSSHANHSIAAPPLAIAAGPSHPSQDVEHRNRVHQRGLGPDRNARRRDHHHRNGRSRHETSM